VKFAPRESYTMYSIANYVMIGETIRYLILKANSTINLRAAKWGERKYTLEYN